MTSQKNVTNSSESKKQSLPDENRRNLGLSVLGLIGGSALLKACALPVSDEGEEGDRLGTAVQALVGANVGWADTVFGPGGPNNRNGDLNNSPASFKDATTLIVKGAEVPGDGGGGIFYWDANGGTDDGGTVIVPNNSTGAWRRVYEGPFNAKWFGTSNMTLAIQNAINAAAVPGQTGGRVYVPPGTHFINKAIDVKSGVELHGAGPSTVLEHTTTILGSNSNYDRAIIKIYGASNVRIYNLRVKGRKNIHSLIDAAQQSGIVVAPRPIIAGAISCSDVVIENCGITNCTGHGIFVNGSRNVQVRGCLITENGVDGVHLYDAKQSMVQGGRSTGNTNRGINSSGASSIDIQIRDCGTDNILTTSSRTSIIGCRVINTALTTGLAAIEVQTPLNGPATSSVTVTNCSVETNSVGIRIAGNRGFRGRQNIVNGNSVVFESSPTLTTIGIELSYQTDACVANNSIRGPHITGIQNAQGQNVTISDNVMSGVVGLGQYGVHLLASPATVVSGNSAGNYDWGVYETNSSDNLVAGNVLKPAKTAYGTNVLNSNTIFAHNIV